jgi:hypothetical protein
MRKAAETLLKVIGTDREVGTHAAVPEFLALTTSIELNKDVYHHFGNLCFNREEYRDALKELAPFFGQMSSPAFSRLMSFAQTLEFHLDIYVGTTIKDAYSLPSWDNEQIAKRAKFLQTFSRTNPPLYTLPELEEETQVRTSYPWQWIDAVRHNYPRRAKEEIITQLIKDPNSNSLLWRIPALIKEMPKEYIQDILGKVKGKIPQKVFTKWERKIEQSYSLKDKI